MKDVRFLQDGTVVNVAFLQILSSAFFKIEKNDGGYCRGSLLFCVVSELVDEPTRNTNIVDDTDPVTLEDPSRRNRLLITAPRIRTEDDGRQAGLFAQNGTHLYCSQWTKCFVNEAQAVDFDIGPKFGD